MSDDNIIDIHRKKKKNKKKEQESLDPKVQALFDLGSKIDALVIQYAQQGFNLFEISAIISHRLGEVIRIMPDKEIYADMLIEIILKKAELTNG